MVQRLVEDRKLNFRPTFLFPVLSSLGIMNADMKQLMKSMVECFKDHQKLVAANVPKAELKNAICFALIRGNALAVSNQGVHGVRTPP